MRDKLEHDIDTTPRCELPGCNEPAVAILPSDVPIETVDLKTGESRIVNFNPNFVCKRCYEFAMGEPPPNAS
jgi:hypothetical protein